MSDTADLGVPVDGVSTSDRPAAHLPAIQLVRLTLYWFGLSSIFSGLSAILGGRLQFDHLVAAGQAGTALLQMVVGGAAIAILVQPTIGTLSDYTMTRWGRRKPYIFIGSLLDVVFLVGIATSNSILAIAAFIVLLQVSSNAAQGPFQGYVPDLVPAPQVGVASALVGLMQVLGNVAGAAVGAVAIATNQFAAATVCLGLIEVTTMLGVVLWVREGRTALPRNGRSWAAIARGAWGMDILHERSFLWLVGSRWAILTGGAVLVNLATFYLARSLGLTQEETGRTYLVVGLTVALAVLVSVIPAARLSDRVGRKRVIWAACGLGAAGLAVVAAAPDLPVAIAGVAAFGVSSGSFLAVDWALMTDIIPKASSGRYMGISNVATASAGVSAIALGGLVMDLVGGPAELGIGPRVALVFGIACFALGAVLLIPVDERRRRGAPTADARPAPAIGGAMGPEASPGQDHGVAAGSSLLVDTGPVMQAVLPAASPGANHPSAEDARAFVRVRSRQMRLGVRAASTFAAVTTSGAIVLRGATGASIAALTPIIALVLVFVAVNLATRRLPARWLDTLAGGLGLVGTLGIAGVMLAGANGLGENAVAFVAIVPLGLALFAPWETPTHVIWLLANGVLLVAAVLVAPQSSPVVRNAIGLLAGFGLGAAFSVVGQRLLEGSRQHIFRQAADAHARRRELEAARRASAATARQIQAVEAIGRTLAEGPTPEALDSMVGLLVDVFGYAYPSVYFGDERLVRLGAQRGYEEPILAFDGSRGILGRVMHSRRTVFLPDVAADPEFVRADPAVLSEVAVPLLAHDVFLGILNVESRVRMDEHDLSAVTIVADRVAAAIALADERTKLAARAAIFGRLVAASSRVSRLLGESELHRLVVDAACDVVPANLVALVTLDHGSGDYLVRADAGGAGLVGTVIERGEGMAGRAIRDRALVVGEITREMFPAAVRDSALPDQYATAAGVPLLSDGLPIGALVVGRAEAGQTFSDLEIEALTLLANQVALVISNAYLHAEVAELAIRDSLTGLHNRRYFDNAFSQMLGARARQPEATRPPLSAVMFDLDRFGEFNNLHGHQAGDEVLRTFGRILKGRLRESDLVARYGGEEFVAILPGATREDAGRIADEVRVALANAAVRGADGAPLSVTVSAGCTEVDETNPVPQALIRSADVGLQMAKRAGRNCVVAA